MPKQYVDQNGLLYLFTKIKSFFVAKEAGKGLSTNDFDATYKSKLDGIETGAQKNVQSDWSAASGDGFIKNKPTIPSKTSDLQNDAGFITASQVPDGATASATVPKMNGSASAGTETSFARGDHVHPTDTTRVPHTRKINGHALSADVDLTAEDVGAPPTSRTINEKPLSDNVTLTAADVGAVPTARKVNGKPLSADVVLAAADVNAVPNTRTVNKKALSADITLSADDVGAAPNTRTINSKPLTSDITLSASDVGAVPTTRTINGKPMSGNISLAATDVGAIASTSRGVANGVASLDADGKVPSAQLPSYVDDVIEGYYDESSKSFYSEANLTGKLTGEKSKIYLDLNTDNSYRYSGSAYVLITSSDMVAITNAEIDEIFANA